MTDLSPQARAVLVAVEDHGKFSYARLAVAALRAAVEVVVPEKDTTSSPCREHCVIGSAPERIRRELLNIATELESHP